MARLTMRDGDGKPDLVACFQCDKMGPDGCLHECGACEHFQAAIDKLCELEEWEPSAEVKRGAVWQRQLYERAIARYGEEKQIIKAIEELGELSVELARALLNKRQDEKQLSDLREELADVCIMCDQLQLIFDDVSDWELFKLERLERRLNMGE